LIRSERRRRGGKLSLFRTLLCSALLGDGDGDGDGRRKKKEEEGTKIAYEKERKTGKNSSQNFSEKACFANLQK
jgi:hypothetical protein